MERFFQLVTSRRRTVVALASLVLAGAAITSSGLEIDYSVEQFFPTWGEERALFDEYRAIFPREDAQVAFFLETPSGLDEASSRTLDAVAGAFQDVGLTDVWWAGRAGDDAIFRRFLWNDERTVHAVQGILPPERNDDENRRRVADLLESRIASLGIDERWSLSGTPMLRAQVPKLLEVDQNLLLGGGVLLFFVVLYAFVGHAGRVLLALAAVLPAYLVTLALMAALGKPVTIMTSFIPIVILVVGVCDSTHLLSHWMRHRAAGLAPVHAATLTFAELASSCFFTSVTTALGFLSLVATGIGVVSDFGVFTAFAVMTTFAFTLTLLPALLAFGREGRVHAPPALAPRLVRPIVRGARSLARERSATPVFAFGALAAVCLAAGSRIPIDTYLVDDLKEDTRILRDLRWIEASGFGLFQTNVFVRGDGPRLLDAEMLAWMERTQRALENEAIVTATLSPADLVRVASGHATEQDASDLQAMLGSLLRPDHGAAQIVVSVEDAGSLRTLPFLERVDSVLDADPPPHGSADVTGTVLMAHTFSSHVLRSFAPSIALSLVMIWLVMSGLFGSLRLGLVAMVPNLFPLVALAGVMAWLGVPLKPSSILVFSIAFGIAVDDSIHLMGRFRHLLRRGHGRERAIRGALRDTGPALVMSTVVVGGGFSLLLLSRFELLHLVGLLTATAAVAALAADLYLFPALLRLTPARWGSSRESSWPPAA